jgi:arsenical pump membrane protein
MFFGLLIAPFVTWSIAASTIAAMFVRPRRIPEAVWTCLGASLLLALQLISFDEALRAVTKGYDVYLFLTGMMVLAELARREAVFDWLAGVALRAAAGSRARLFALVYLVGIVVTTVMSNDATAVVLTPAVFVLMRKAKCDPVPYLFACAFIANAASFVLPISNPANLVLFGDKLPLFFHGCEHSLCRQAQRFSQPTSPSALSFGESLKAQFHRFPRNSDSQSPGN